MKNHIKDRFVSIAGKRVIVSYVNQMEDDYGNRILGRYESAKRKIEIDKTQKKKESFDTLAHETVHAAIDLYHFPGLDELHEETLASIIGEAITAVFWPLFETQRKKNQNAASRTKQSKQRESIPPT